MIAFFVKCGYSVPEDVHSAWDYAHSVYVWHGSVDYSNNSRVFRWILNHGSHFVGPKSGVTKWDPPKTIEKFI